MGASECKIATGSLLTSQVNSRPPILRTENKQMSQANVISPMLTIVDEHILSKRQKLSTGNKPTTSVNDSNRVLEKKCKKSRVNDSKHVLKKRRKQSQVVDRFYIVLFSTLKQTHCTHM